MIVFNPMINRTLSFLFCISFFCSFSLAATEQKPVFLVSVAPYRFFVEKIAGDFGDVELLVPAGASAHTFEPNPKQMMQAAQATIWFRIGEPFEEKAFHALMATKPSLKTVNLWEGLSLLHGECKAHKHCGADLHLWTSPKNGMFQARMIANALIANYPAETTRFQENLNRLLQELVELSQYIEKKTAHLKNRAFVVSHPAYGYLCRDYNLEQVSIEFEGRDPTPKQLTQLLAKVKQVRPKAIFTQPQYSDKAAKLIASTIGAAVVELDPYSEHYITEMQKIADAIAEYNGE
jgi:zinc transport system substrate-binding protein